MIKIKKPNCIVKVYKTSLTLTTKGGAHFNLELEAPIVEVFPMAEGLIIQFVVRPELKLSEIVKIQRSK